jgi:hypothetical protein
MFIVPAPGGNGQNGGFVPGRRGFSALANPQLLASYTKAAAFPRELLHPTTAERVWAALARGNTMRPCSMPFELSRKQSARLVTMH